jgi:CDP-diacylglycerol--glycerol-3-phosphate 3-phosphatidyltransferase
MTHPRPLNAPLRLFLAMLGYGVALALGYGLLATTLRSDVAVQWLALSSLVAVFELGVCWRALANHWTADSQVLGVANGLTLLRGLFCALAAGFLLAPRPSGWGGWLPAGLCALCGLLDYADGAVARRSDWETALGARLDIEFDAVLTLVTAALCVRYGQVPLAYLGVGLARYVYVSGIWLRRWLDKPVHDLPESRVRRYLYVVQLCFGVGVLTPLLGPPITSYGALCVMTVFLSGFVRDWLFIIGRLGTPFRAGSARGEQG